MADSGGGNNSFNFIKKPNKKRTIKRTETGVINLPNENSDPTKAMLPSLFAFVESKTEQDARYNTQRLCLVAKHTLEGYMVSYNAVVEAVKKDPTNLNLHSSLLSISDRVRSVANEIVNILKKSAEVDVLVSTKFDALQVVALIQQLPSEMNSVLEEALRFMLDDITDHVDLVINSRPDLSLQQKKEILGELTSHKYLRKSKIFVIAEIIKSITEEMSARIEELTIPVNQASKNTENTSAAFNPVESQVLEMNGMIPLEEVSSEE